MYICVFVNMELTNCPVQDAAVGVCVYICVCVFVNMEHTDYAVQDVTVGARVCIYIHVFVNMELTDCAVQDAAVGAWQHRLKAHTVAGRGAQVLTPLLRHALCDRHGADAARLCAHDGAVRAGATRDEVVEDVLWHLVAKIQIPHIKAAYSHGNTKNT